MDVGAKLQIKPGQSVAILDAPADVTFALPGNHPRASGPAAADAVIAFVRRGDDLNLPSAEQALAAARDDRLAWIAYPKAGQLDTDLNRDKLAAAVGDRGVRPVRQVSIDAVWSALRFRPA